jgi:hypothetical protein
MSRHACVCYVLGDLASGLMEVAESAYTQHTMSVDEYGEPYGYTYGDVARYPLKDLFAICERIALEYPQYYDDLAAIGDQIGRICTVVNEVLESHKEPDEGLVPLLEELMGLCGATAKKMLGGCGEGPVPSSVQLWD